jgi:hypothetical protein
MSKDEQTEDEENRTEHISRDKLRLHMGDAAATAAAAAPSAAKAYLLYHICCYAKFVVPYLSGCLFLFCVSPKQHNPRGGVVHNQTSPHEQLEEKPVAQP